MLQSPMAHRGMVTSPHHLASQAGLAVLRDGGTAIEAAIATAAMLCVVYPHMTGLGGDAFWLIAEPGKPPVSIDGSGASGAKVDVDLYRRRGLGAVPTRGPLSANTVAGAVSSWQLALDVSAHWRGTLPLSRLFEDAMDTALNGFAVSAHQSAASLRNMAALKDQPGFADQFLVKRKPPPAGTLLRLPALAETFRRLAAVGLDDFYRGEIGRANAAGLAAAGSPLRAEDLARHRGMRRRPLSLGIPSGTLFNTAPPTQGLASLILLGLFQRLNVTEAEGFDHIHGLIEAAKLAHGVRDAHVTDPARMSVHAATYLTDGVLNHMAAGIDRQRASPTVGDGTDGDTVWLGVVDGQGRSVSYIQSLFHAFGSGVTLPDTGIVWQCRGSSFSLDPNHRNVLEPRRRPFHTLSPGLARLRDGRTMVYGTMGGDSQPIVQAEVFTRAALFGQGLQQAVSAPRWALGRALDGTPGSGIQVEARLDPALVQCLRQAGHDIQVVGDWDSLLGHAGALCRRADGMIEGAADPRSDGSVAGY
ncbi:gamma-glutamyltransferase [Paramagnetospirillum kuznetsovii]|uniref:Gamma-glutamyltransferase n=1 Tax=Paramagnetospirillum kuznetsovii TaxID=2053833 RepID=A0A364NYQ6_9PROT|nr:gamma-glutamyltransferase family protein [Paramagnetospirillum kuznetsovii]RAU22047.1 gamma-glutamyltransferase [Paramagnetospirillum kuznetsovii]